jgi:hypothetical protein
MVGRPSPIDAVIGYRDTPEGQVEVTVSDRIVAALRAGNYLDPAAAAAGIPVDTVKGWLRLAGRLLIKHRGDTEAATLTAHERRCIAFSHAVEEAEATWEVDANTTHERLARGGLPQVTETIKRGPSPGNGEPGPVLEVQTRTTHTLPDARVIEWRLKHRFPERYSDRIEVSGPGGGPIELSQEERASALAELARVFRKAKEPPARRLRPKKKEFTDGSDPTA